VNEGEVVLKLDPRSVRERVWNPGRGSGRQTGGIASTETSSQRGHDRRREHARFSVHPIGHVYLPCPPIPLCPPTEHDMVDGPKPRPLSGFFLLGVLVPVALWFILRPFLDPVPSVPALYTSLGFSILAFVTTLYLVPALGPRFVQANLKGRDLLKVYSTPMCVDRSTSPFRDPDRIPFKSGESGPRMRFGVHTVLDPLYPVRLFQCVCRPIQQPTEIRAWSRH
jgi:hypothetical protein